MEQFQLVPLLLGEEQLVLLEVDDAGLKKVMELLFEVVLLPQVAF